MVEMFNIVLCVICLLGFYQALKVKVRFGFVHSIKFSESVPYAGWLISDSLTDLVNEYTSSVKFH